MASATSTKVSVAAGLTGGFALSASGSRSAILDAMRARTQVAGLVAAASVVVIVLLAPGVVALVPKAALAGIVVYAGMHLVRSTDPIATWPGITSAPSSVLKSASRPRKCSFAKA